MGTDFKDADDFCATVLTILTAVSFFSQLINQRLLLDSGSANRTLCCPPRWGGETVLTAISQTGHQSGNNEEEASLPTELLFQASLSLTFRRASSPKLLESLILSLPFKLSLILQGLVQVPSLTKPPLTLWPFLFTVCVGYSTITSVYVNVLQNVDPGRC